MGHYGDGGTHICKKCGHEGMDIEFNPILKPDTLEDGTEITVVGFQCPKCRKEFYEQEETLNADQTRLVDFED